MLFRKAKYSSWVPTNAYKDTGERSGFVRSILEGGGEEESLDESELDGQENDGEAVPLPDPTQSAAALAIMHGVQVPAMPVSTACERTKFGEMWLTFARASGSQSCPDFDAFAIEWNKAVYAIEE